MSHRRYDEYLYRELRSRRLTALRTISILVPNQTVLRKTIRPMKVHNTRYQEIRRQISMNRKSLRNAHRDIHLFEKFCEEYGI